MTAYVERLEDGVAWVGQWLRRTEWWKVALVAMVGLIILPTLPVLFALAFCLALAMFVRVWAREVLFLMRLNDDVFPGRNDKLVWSFLLICMPPVGYFLFRTFREAHWPGKRESSRPYDLF